MTAKIFEAAGLDYKIVVETQEVDQYVAALPPKRVLELPFSNLGLGSYPARNFCWDHSIDNGHAKHWVFDDNIMCFRKWINGKRLKYEDIKSAIIYVEQYSDFHNIDICGFEEHNFVVKAPKSAFKRNCHVYSTLLIKNNLDKRWRLKYNEDVDLCLQVLSSGGSTASCVYYMADKVSTSVKMKGGNQDELYKGNKPQKNLLKAKILESVWPQYAKTVIRFGRHHHLVNWRVFQKNIASNDKAKARSNNIKSTEEPKK